MKFALLGKQRRRDAPLLHLLVDPLVADEGYDGRVVLAAILKRLLDAAEKELREGLLRVARSAHQSSSTQRGREQRRHGQGVRRQRAKNSSGWRIKR